MVGNRNEFTDECRDASGESDKFKCYHYNVCSVDAVRNSIYVYDWCIQKVFIDNRTSAGSATSRKLSMPDNATEIKYHKTTFSNHSRIVNASK